MLYDIEADWQLLNTCNYRCTYCFFSSDILGEKLKTCAAAHRWGDAIDSTSLTWLLHMTGGEPSAYQDFVELCARLTARHFISLNSNMTNRAWEDFSRSIDPSRVAFVNAGLHLEERERRKEISSYLRNIEALSSRGFLVLPSLVATPTALHRFEEAIELLRPLALFPVPKAIRGAHEGNWYPYGYSAADRKLFLTYSNAAKSFYRDKLKELPTIDVFHDDAILYGEPTFKGLWCEAGHKLVKIEPNGDVYRCSPDSGVIGNLLDGTFKRDDGPSRCETSYCYYFCQKYAEKSTRDEHLRRATHIAAHHLHDRTRYLKRFAKKRFSSR